ncbi:sigma-70 family RNA polymerase sigma factor [Algoriphagus sp.]|uniref:RNA polymerase sigma factor n=1 Tax=Algoriphagus sp. TaxID=1872435 RepID=UPI002631017C|nr:sigma-70 family RNA polymerase sigma factor [Algoriphagus sp.]
MTQNRVNPQPSSAEINDQELWESLIKGDRAAFGLIYQRTIQDLYRFGCSLVSDEDLVLDSIQEVFVDLWKYHSHLQKTDKIKVYLFKCLSNRIHKESMQQNKRKTKNEFFIAGEESAIESIEDRLVLNTYNQGMKAQLSKALQQLPFRQKEVINCLFFEDFSYEDTAKIMNINLRSVYTLAWKAISNLKSSISIKIIIGFIILMSK